MNQLLRNVCSSCKMHRGNHLKMGKDAALHSRRRLFSRALLALLALVGCGSSLTAQTISGTATVCAAAATALTTDLSGGAWSSSNSSVATVGSGGVVTGISAGTATISYVAGSDVATVVVTVNALPNAGSISGNQSVCIGYSMTLSSSGASGGVWSADNDIVSVVGSANGMVSGIAMGSDTIRYTVANSCGTSVTKKSIAVSGNVGDIYTYAGNGTSGFSGDNGPAFEAMVNQPRDMFADNIGNIFFCDQANNRVRKISRAGIITTVAGSGSTGNSGDGGQATDATLTSPNGVFVNSDGIIFISNTGSHTIRKVDGSGIITTIAGTSGTSGFLGDGGAASAARLNSPLGLVADVSGNLYIGDQGNNRVRKIDASTGVITTVVGNGTTTYRSADDGGPASAAQLSIRGLGIDNAGNLYVADAVNNRIRKYYPSTGIITTFAGNGSAGHAGDGGPATAASLAAPARFAYDGANIIYICDQSNQAIRQVNLATGLISQVAGNGTGGFSGDSGPATDAELRAPVGIAVDHFGSFFISDANNARIRTVPSYGSLSISGPGPVCSSASATLTSFLSGTGDPSYQWQKNGANISGANSSTLTVSSPANGDVYRLIVTITPACTGYVFDDTSNNITLSVTQAISDITGNTHIGIGQTTTLSDAAPGGTWTSSNTSVATIGTDGVATGLSAGTSNITYSVANVVCGSTSSVLTVTVSVIDTISSTAGSNGNITPDGTVNTVDPQVYTITPNTGYHVADVVVNGTSVGAVTSYTVSPTSSPQTISVSFAPDCVGPSITSAATATSVSCYGGSDGSVTTSVSGSSLSYVWSNAATTSGLSAVPAGTYSYTVSNSCGSASGSATVGTPSALAVSLTPSNVLCNTANGGSHATGSISASVSGGTGSYSYSWVGGNEAASGQDPTGLTAGSYSVTVTDANGCSAVASAAVDQNSEVTVSLTASNVLCNSANGGAHNSGSVTASATGGSGSGYSYAWSNGATTNQAASLVVGTYTVTVSDANSCTAAGSATVDQNTAISVSVTSSNVLCNAANSGDHNTGSATASASGGSGTYSYAWNNSATSNPATGLATGAYSVTVTDGNSCTAAGSVTVGENSAVVAANSVTNVSCNGGSTGSVSVTASGGTSPYSGTGAVNNLPAGSYSYTVTDANGCATTTAAAITEPSALAAASSVTNAACNGGSTGSVSMSATGGTSPYSGTGSFSGLSAGSYSYTVTDANGCTASASATVTEPSALTASSGVTNVSCYGGNTGSVTVSATGGTTPYSGTGTNSSLSAGSYSYTVTDANGCTATASGSVTQPSASLSASASVTDVLCSGGSTGAIMVSAAGGTTPYSGATNHTDLTAGSYSYTVSDANGCTASVSATVSQPSSLTASSSASNVACYGGTTGSVNVSATGGTTPYSGATNHTGLTAGSYSYTVTDANGCTSATSATVTEPSALAATATATNANCNGGNTGSITVSATGGTTPYSGTGTNSNLAAGAYNYTVTDANGCSATASATVGQPSALTASSSVTNVSCYGGSTGSVSVSATGGTSPYSGITSHSNLSAGSYSYTVTDANGCTATTSATLTQPSSALSASSSVTNVSCYGGNTGSVTVSAAGGTSPYSGTSAHTSMSAGSYSYTVTDASGCTATTTGSLTQPAALTVTTSVTNVSCSGANGNIAASCSGGTSSYTYAWSNSCTNATSTGLAAGSYSVTVTDAHSCTASASATVGTSSESIICTITGDNITGTHVCDAQCHHNSSHVCGPGCDHYGHSCTAACHHNSGHTCTGNHTGDHHCDADCHHNSGHTCTPACDHYSAGCTPACHHNSAHHCNHNHCARASELGGVVKTYYAPAGMSSYSWAVTGGDHVCDSKCHHNSGHTCGVGCDHYGHSCTAACHHNSAHTCTFNHIGDHHCNIYCHHNSGHTCTPDCDHYGHSCTSACHHNSAHRCGHDHCSGASITGSSTSSSVNIAVPSCVTSYTVTLTVTNSGGCTGSSSLAVKTIPSAKITVYSSLYTTSDGYHPTVSKCALPASLKVYNRHTAGACDGSQSHYSSVWNGTGGQVTNCSISAPETVSMGGGPVYRYTVTVPAGGQYLVVGKSTISSSRYSGGTCTLYTAQKSGDYDSVDGDDHSNDDPLTPWSSPQTRYHYCLKDNTGKCQEAWTQEEHGSLLLIVSPMALTFEDSVSLLPVIYESVIGDWSASVSADPPYGFYTDPATELSTSVTDSVVNAVQFSVIDTGSDWTFTKLTHNIMHKGEPRVAYSKPVMINNRTNKPSGISVSPNPADNEIRIVMSRFEGKATVHIYDMLGQEVARKPINVISGASVAMDVSKLPPGVYMVTAENSYGKATTRLVKSGE